jgi:hypothetical protein
LALALAVHTLSRRRVACFALALAAHTLKRRRVACLRWQRRLVYTNLIQLAEVLHPARLHTVCRQHIRLRLACLRQQRFLAYTNLIQLAEMLQPALLRVACRQCIRWKLACLRRQHHLACTKLAQLATVPALMTHTCVALVTRHLLGRRGAELLVQFCEAFGRALLRPDACSELAGRVRKQRLHSALLASRFVHNRAGGFL